MVSRLRRWSTAVRCLGGASPAATRLRIKAPWFQLWFHQKLPRWTPPRWTPPRWTPPGGTLLRVLDPQFYSAGCLASLLAALAVLGLILAPGEYTATRGRWLLTALLFGGYCLTTLGPAVLAQRGGPALAAASGALMAALAFALWLVGVWATPDPGGFWKAAAITTCLAIGVSYASVTLWHGPAAGLARRALRLSAMAGLVGVAAASVGIAFEVRTPPFWWAVTLIALVWAATGLALPWAVFRHPREPGRVM